MSGQYTFEDQEGALRARGAWERARQTLSQEIPATHFKRFITPLRAVDVANGTVVLEVPSMFVLEWVRSKYSNRIESTLADELGQTIRLEFRVRPRERDETPVGEELAVVPTIVEHANQFHPMDKYTFDTYIVGQSNRLAVAGARAVAAEPGLKFNPLFIYGPSGLGKTHLLHAIAQEMLERDPKAHVAYLSAQQFTEQFVEALQNKRIDQFRRAQRNVSIWLVDDIQFVAGRDRTQEEIFHTFNYLHQTGKQIVLCSDRPPRELFLMDERLRSRFEAGLVADIQSPNTELRCAILLSKAKQEGISLDVSVAMFIAENVPGNVRILEGALTKLAAQASLESNMITLDLASELIERYYASGTLARPGFEQIVEAVSKYYKVPTDEIKGISRKAPITHARHVAVYIAREITGDSWKHIGSQFGNRDHTSMMHAYQKISEMMARDRDFTSAVKAIMRNLFPDVN